MHPGDSYVTLTMKLNKRSNVDLVDLPEWKIKVTQLQCGGNGKNDYLSQYDFPLLGKTFVFDLNIVYYLVYCST